MITAFVWFAIAAGIAALFWPLWLAGGISLLAARLALEARDRRAPAL